MCRKRHSGVPCRAEASQGGEYLPIKKRRRKEVGPRLDLTREEAVELQLAVPAPYQTASLGRHPAQASTMTTGALQCRH